MGFNDWLMAVNETYGNEYTREVDAQFYGKHKYYRGDPSRRRETGQRESRLAYSVIREIKPEVVWDIGSGDGGSTYPLALAVKKNGKGRLYTFESIYERFLNARENLNDMHDIITFVPGNVMETHTAYSGKIDVLMIDAAHEASFARWHIQTLWPRATLIHVHDVYYGDHVIEDESAVVLQALKDSGVDWLPDHTLLGRVGDDEDGPGSANSGVWIKNLTNTRVS